MTITRYQFKLNGKQFVLASDHDDEVARLKAEVDKLTFRPEHYLDDDGEWVSNIVFYRMQERLKAEVERLKEDKQQLEARLDFLENPRS